MKKRLSVLMVLLMVAVAAFAGGKQETQAPAAQTTAPAAQAPTVESTYSGDFAFGGSTTVDPIITAAIEEWKELYPSVHISYEGVGSSTGIKGVLAGTYSLGAASRELKSSEAESGAKTTPVALDAIAIVVNSASVNVSNITVEDAAKIYAGEITNWSQVGGANAPIVVFNRDEASGTYETFEVKVMGDMEFMKSASVTTGNGDMAAKVGATPNSIGYVGLGFIGEKGLKALSLDGVDATIDNVYNGSYAVQRFLNVVYTELGEVEDAFVNYILSADGQDIVADLDFIPLPSISSYSGNYAFGGSTTVDPIITATIEDWKELNPNVHISYEGVGSSTGIKGVIAGTYSLGAASREPKDSEKAQGVVAEAVALDAIAIVVNSSSVSLSNITVENAAKIYAGEITNWSQIGGADAPIVVFNRDEASGTYETFEVKVMGDYEFMKSASVTTGNGDMAAKVGATPNSIGYVGLGFVGEKGLKALTLNGVEATVDNVYNGSYAVQRNLNVVYAGSIAGLERAFVNYILSDDGQDIVADLDFIPLP